MVIFMAKVSVKCYDEIKTFTSKKAALAYFKEGMYSCDPGSSEYERYDLIVAQLKAGETYATDNINELNTIFI